MKFSYKAAALAAILALPAAAHAQTYQLYVGYVDGLRGAVNFPSIWAGDALVDNFRGFSGANPDAGAIMFKNTGASTMSISGLTYSLGGYSYNFFPAVTPSISVAAGHYAIFTGLDNSGDFDTSDYSVGPCNAPNTTAPALTATVGATTSGYQDTGLILSTGGVDRAVCPGSSNESLGWRLVGTTSYNNPTNQLDVVPEPSTIALSATGLLALFGFSFRRRNSK